MLYLDAARVIFKEEGARGLYQYFSPFLFVSFSFFYFFIFPPFFYYNSYAGFTLSLFNNIHGVVQLVTYERLRLLMLKLNAEDSDNKNKLVCIIIFILNLLLF